MLTQTKTQKLVYSSQQHLHERCRIKVYVPGDSYYVRGINDIKNFIHYRNEMKRRDIYFKSMSLIDKIILNHKEKLVLRRKKLC